MNDDEFLQYLLFKLMDYDIGDAKYVAVDDDGEIVVSNVEMHYGNCSWVLNDSDFIIDCPLLDRTGNYIDTKYLRYGWKLSQLKL